MSDDDLLISELPLYGSSLAPLTIEGKVSDLVGYIIEHAGYMTYTLRLWDLGEDRELHESEHENVRSALKQLQEQAKVLQEKEQEPARILQEQAKTARKQAKAKTAQKPERVHAPSRLARQRPPSDKRLLEADWILSDVYRELTFMCRHELYETDDIKSVAGTLCYLRELLDTIGAGGAEDELCEERYATERLAERERLELSEQEQEQDRELELEQKEQETTTLEVTDEQRDALRKLLITVNFGTLRNRNRKERDRTGN